MLAQKIPEIHSFSVAQAIAGYLPVAEASLCMGRGSRDL